MEERMHTNIAERPPTTRKASYKVEHYLGHLHKKPWFLGSFIIHLEEFMKRLIKPQDGWMDRWMDGWVDRQMAGRTDRWVDKWMNGCSFVLKS